jgi:flagellar P-ring protein precursor FlgI
MTIRSSVPTAAALLLLTAIAAWAQEPPAPPEEPRAPAVEPAAAQPAAAAQTLPAAGAVRLKDVASIQGEASMPLVGYGLVVGLNRTGDRRQTIFPAQTLAAMLERFGQSVPAGALKVENIAAVMVTAQVGPYAQAGSRLDVTAASVGDARSLQGGVLMPTGLRGPDGSLVAIAQGPLTLGGFGAGGGGNTVQVNHLTVGRVSGGGLLQVSQSNGMPAADVVRLALRDPDFASARSIAQALNQELGAGSARVLDAGAIAIQVPAEYRTEIPELIARIEPLPVGLDTPARVVINERTGTVVLGGDIRIGEAFVIHGRLSVRIATQYEVSQPAPFSAGRTEVVPQTEVDVEETAAQMVDLQPGATLRDIVRALTTLGATPRDIITILGQLKATGALRAEVVTL